jgi:bacterioferritin-associated ferredoxin
MLSMRIITVLIEDDRLYICICNAVTQKAVEQCAREGARSVDDLAAQLGIGAGCGRCRECAMEILGDFCGARREKQGELAAA